MSEVNKYLRNGAINPLWAEIQYNEACDKYELELQERIQQQQLNHFINLINRTQQATQNDQMIMYAKTLMVRKTNSEKITLKDKFDFLKSHSDNKEDLELAKFILSTESN